MMEVTFEDDHLQALAGGHSGSTYPPAICKALQKRVVYMRGALDERDFHQMRSLNFEKLKGDRSGQYSMRLSDQWRLILGFRGEAPNKTVIVISIEDYH